MYGRRPKLAPQLNYRQSHSSKTVAAVLYGALKFWDVQERIFVGRSLIQTGSVHSIAISLTTGQFPAEEMMAPSSSGM
jgi:hypothetical protein